MHRDNAAQRIIDKTVAEFKRVEWLKPQEKPDEWKLQRIVDEIAAAFKLDDKPKVLVRGLMGIEGWHDTEQIATDDVWVDALDDAVGVIRKSIGDAPLNAIVDALWDIVHTAKKVAFRAVFLNRPGAAVEEAVLDAIWSAKKDFIWGAAWEMAPTLLGYNTNPFAKLIKLWKMGLHPIGIVDGKFLIYYLPTERVRIAYSI